MLERRGHRIGVSQGRALIATDHRRYHIAHEQRALNCRPLLVAPLLGVQRVVSNRGEGESCAGDPNEGRVPRPSVLIDDGRKRRDRSDDALASSAMIAKRLGRAAMWWPFLTASSCKAGNRGKSATSSPATPPRRPA
jgi:hypothetical protein